ncbi:hypothetical protein BC938DRAFT_471063 [Jimgerdemannia flammicorona]|uniref:Uncharacterized protein n=1 Tax=Jimgerdemannia flammicorona TaxID=994334 RepID=A0A433QUX4_9FUNG|nr:hypothetical protein BC938DRAFT_471063 [Jimgerdemannia flammicorona]
MEEKKKNIWKIPTNSLMPYRLNIRLSKQTSTYQILIPSDEHGIEHGLVQQKVPHPLGDDDVDLLNG